MCPVVSISSANSSSQACLNSSGTVVPCNWKKNCVHCFALSEGNASESPSPDLGIQLLMFKIVGKHLLTESFTMVIRLQIKMHESCPFLKLLVIQLIRLPKFNQKSTYVKAVFDVENDYYFTTTAVGHHLLQTSFNPWNLKNSTCCMFECILKCVDEATSWVLMEILEDQ